MARPPRTGEGSVSILLALGLGLIAGVLIAAVVIFRWLDRDRLKIDLGGIS